MRKFLVLVFLIVFIFNIDIVKAEMCDSVDIARAKELAKNVSYDYKYIGDDEDYQLYEVSFTGLSGNNFYIMNEEEKVALDGDKIKLDSGIKYLDIYYEPCDDMRIKSIKIELPKFNEYSLSEYCDSSDFKNFEYCDEWYSGKVNNKIFDAAVKEYEKKIEEESKSDSDKIIETLWENKYLVGGIVVFLVAIIAIVVIRSKAKNTLD